MSDVGFSIEAFIDLHEQVKGMHRTMKERHAYSRPVYKSVMGSITLQTGFTSPTLFACEGTPAVGRMWNVRWAGIYFTDAHSTTANVNADIFTGAPPLPGQTPPVMDIIHSLYAIPGDIGPFSKDVFWCLPGGNVYGQVYGTGLAVGQTYILAAKVAEHRLYDVNSRDIP